MPMLTGDTMRRIRTICAQHRVASLWLFGSIVRDDYEPSRSDIDAIVTFEDMPYRERADHYYALRSSLSDLLGEPVELLEDGAITNPYFRQEVDRSRVQIYAA